MKKNCLITSVTGSEIFLIQIKLLLESLVRLNNDFDAYITTDSYLINHLKEICKELNVNLIPIVVEDQKTQHHDMKLKFNSIKYIEKNKYENIVYADSDILFFNSINEICNLRKEVKNNIISATAEKGHDINGYHFGSGFFTHQEIEIFKEKNIEPLNAGFLISSGDECGIETFLKLEEFVQKFVGGFYDQTAVNLFLLRNNLVETKSLEKVICFHENNINNDSTIIHFIGAGDVSKPERMLRLLKNYRI